MSTAEILLRLVDGRRQPFDSAADLLLTVRDGNQNTVVSRFVTCGPSGEIHVEKLRVHDNLADRYTVLVSTRHHTDAGFTPVTVKADTQQTLDLMLLRREASFDFAAFDQIAISHPDTHSLICGGSTTPGEGERIYNDLKTDNAFALACLLNITTALTQITLSPAPGIDPMPLRSFKALRLDPDHAPQRDRFFAWVDRRLVQQVAGTVGAAGVNTVVPAPKGLHPGATSSFKQADFGEGNVQFTFHENDRQPLDGTECVGIEVDIDYFRDPGAHILLEVFPNKLKEKVNTLKGKVLGSESAAALTDPKTVYGLRWIAGRRLGVDFAPPYTLQ